MSVKEFTVGFGRTINIGNFNSLRIDASVTMEVVSLTEYEALKAEAQKELRELLEQTYKEQNKTK
jgi:hypothetical protein